MNNNTKTTALRYAKQLMICLLAIGLFIPAATLNVQAKKHKNEWVTTKNGRVNYYDKKGNKVNKKKRHIDGKQYSFDKNGNQRVGWIKYKDHISFYNIKPGKKGYLVTDKTVNGIELDERGYAVSNLDKARLLAEANSIAFNITNFNMTQDEKNKACFMYVRDKTDWRNIGSFQSRNANWDIYYASYGIYKKYGDCYTGGASFAYMATAVGSKNVYAESSGGHGWCTIDGYFYDPNWSWATKSVDKYFKVSGSLSGKSGRPNWARHRTYKKRVD